MKKISIELTEEQLEKVKEVIDLEPKAWKPKTGDAYWYVDPYNCIDLYSFDDSDKANNVYWALGNCYKTEKEAEQAANRQKALVKVLSYIRTNFGNWKPDWLERYQYKFYIYYNHKYKKFYCIGDIGSSCHQLVIPYLETKEQAQKIIDKFESELRLIWSLE